MFLRLLFFVTLLGLFMAPARAQRTDWLQVASPQTLPSSPSYLATTRLARDAQDNVYQAIGFQDSMRFAGLPYLSVGPNYNLAVVKRSPSGQVLWSWRPVQPVGVTDGFMIPGQLVTTPTGQVVLSVAFMGTFVVGADTLRSPPVLNGSQPRTLALICFEPSGRVRWARVVAEPTSAGSSIAVSTTGLSVDAEGYILLTGDYYGSARMQQRAVPAGSTSVNRAFCLRTSPTGEVLWVQAILGANSSHGDYAVADPDGNVYFAGTFRVQCVINGQYYGITGAGHTQVYYIKFTPGGQFTSVQVLGNPRGGGYGAGVSGLLAHPSGDIIMQLYGPSTAFGLGLSNPAETFLLRLSPTGVGRWSRRSTGAPISGDRTGNIYVTGSYTSTTVPFLASNLTLPVPAAGTANDLVVMYDEAGSVQWYKVGRQTASPAPLLGAPNQPPLAVTNGRLYLAGMLRNRFDVDGQQVQMYAAAQASYAGWYYTWKLRSPLGFGVAGGRQLACPGTTLTLPFERDSTVFAASSTVVAQLSDATGSFAAPTTVGTTQGLAERGLITITIPATTLPGTNYRLRLRATGLPGPGPQTTGLTSAGDGLTLDIRNGAIARILPLAAGDTIGVCTAPLPLLRADVTLGSTLQWTLNGQPLPGAQADSLRPTQPGLYGLVVTGACGPASARPLQVLLAVPATPTLQPLPQLALASAPAPLSAQPAGGTWSGPGVTANQTFDPAAAGVGTFTLTYTYTNRFGCQSAASMPAQVLTSLATSAAAAAAPVSLSPNPSSGPAVLHLATPAAAPGTVQVFTVQGQRVADYVLPAATQQLALPLHVAAGVYLVRVQVGQATAHTLRLLVQP